MTDTFLDVRTAPEFFAVDAIIDSGAALRDLLLAGEQFRQAIAEHFSIGVTEALAMSHLAAGGSLTPRQLSDRLGLTPSSVTSVLDRLEAAGLAQRSRHATDRRQITILVTPRGLELLDFTERHIGFALAQLTSGELPQTSEILAGLANNLRAQAVAIRQA